MLGMPQGRGGRVKLNSDLSVPDYSEIFVVGDMGEVTHRRERSSATGIRGHAVRRTRGPTDRSPNRTRKQLSPLSIGTRDSWQRSGGALPWSNFQPAEHFTDRSLISLGWVCTALLNGVRNRIETLWKWGWSALTHDRAARIIIEGDEETRKIA
jgi:NADH:ubiquinone reductase (H+-translocating)